MCLAYASMGEQDTGLGQRDTGPMVEEQMGGQGCEQDFVLSCFVSFFTRKIDKWIHHTRVDSNSHNYIKFIELLHVTTPCLVHCIYYLSKSSQQSYVR